MQDDDLITRIHALTSPLTPEPTGLKPCIDPLDDIRAVLFDVYGTLVISGCGDIGLTCKPLDGMQVRPNFFRQALSSIGLDISLLPDDFDGTVALNKIIATNHSVSRSQGVDYPEVDILAVWLALLSELNLAIPEHEIRCLAVEYEFRSNLVWPMPGLTKVIKAINEQGLVLGIVSNAQFYTPIMLNAFLGCDIAAGGFDPRCCAWSYQHLVGKPSTRIYEPALAALDHYHGIGPEQVLYVGNDLRNDIWPASQLGCHTALFAGDARSLRLRKEDTHLKNVHPDRVFTNLEHVMTSLWQEQGGSVSKPSSK